MAFCYDTDVLKYKSVLTHVNIYSMYMYVLHNRRTCLVAETSRLTLRRCIALDPRL